MKLIITIIFFATIQLNAQKLYRELPEKKINIEKANLTKDFISDFLQKCAVKDYTNFEKYKLSNHFKKFINENLEKVCEFL